MPYGNAPQPSTIQTHWRTTIRERWLIAHRDQSIRTFFPSEPVILVDLLWIEAHIADLDLHQGNPACLAAYRLNNPVWAQLLWRVSAATVQLVRNFCETAKSARRPTGKANNRPAELGNCTDHRKERRSRPKLGFSVTLDVDRRKKPNLMSAHRRVLLGRHLCSSS
ncbi:MAG: hypothetical protein IH830_01455 [Planctomycetes bacterium]|nr:hypothetical protein [Planctomycetota bacterium]